MNLPDACCRKALIWPAAERDTGTMYCADSLSEIFSRYALRQALLDPIVAIRHRITLDPEESATINIVTGIGENRAACLGLVEK